MAREKHKGTGDYERRDGLGRLRRANAKDAGRIGGWENRAEDDEFLERHAHRSRAANLGESLLAKFNRIAALTADALPPGVPAEICSFQGPEVLVRLADGGERPAIVRQSLKKRVSGVKNPLCIGDRVRVEEEAGGLAVAAVLPRRSQLVRADSHNRALLHVLAANLDRVVVVAACAAPDPKPGLIDRYLLLCAASDLEPVLVFSKRDLADPRPLADVYRGLGYPVFETSAGDPASVDGLRTHLHGLACVVTGQSGVGKSSLINTLFPGIGAKVGQVAGEGFGRHTTSASRGYALPGGGRLLDTPGIRECAVTGLEPLDVALLYRDLAAHHGACRFADCSHRHEPDCAVRAAVASGAIAASRYQSYLAILAEDLGVQ